MFSHRSAEQEAKDRAMPGIAGIIDDFGPKNSVASMTKLPPVPRNIALCKKQLGDLKFQDLPDRGLQLPPYRFRLSDTVYCGEWRNNMPHGRGEVYFANGDFYEGTFQNGNPVGVGRFISENGSYYQGAIMDGEANGYGVAFSTETETRYQGNFVNDIPNGRGIQITGQKNGHFVGEFRDGVKVQGVYTWGKGGQFKYEGGFADGMFAGDGRVTSPAGVFTGQFKDGARSGHGCMTWKDGRRYIGGYDNDVKTGYGELYNHDGSLSYKGDWLADLPNGQGVGIINGREVAGHWVNGFINTPLAPAVPLVPVVMAPAVPVASVVVAPQVLTSVVTPIRPAVPIAAPRVYYPTA